MRKGVGSERRYLAVFIVAARGKAPASHCLCIAHTVSLHSDHDDGDDVQMADDSVEDTVEAGTISDVLTNEAVPRTSATITVRIIKSFEYRTEKNLVLRDLNLETTTVGALKDIARQTILSDAKWKPFRTAKLGASVPVACSMRRILSVQ